MTVRNASNDSVRVGDDFYVAFLNECYEQDEYGANYQLAMALSKLKDAQADIAARDERIKELSSLELSNRSLMKHNEKVQAKERAARTRVRELEQYIDAWEQVGRSLYQQATGKTIEQFGAHEIGEVQRVVLAYVMASPLARVRELEAALSYELRLHQPTGPRAPRSERQCGYCSDVWVSDGCATNARLKAALASATTEPAQPDVRALERADD